MDCTFKCNQLNLASAAQIACLVSSKKFECRTKHPTDKTPHVHFVIGGRKPPHVFLKADKTPHAQKYNVDKTPHADFKIRTKPLMFLQCR